MSFAPYHDDVASWRVGEGRSVHCFGYVRLVLVDSSVRITPGNPSS